MILFFQAEDGIRDLVRSRGLGDVYKRQMLVEHRERILREFEVEARQCAPRSADQIERKSGPVSYTHLTLPTSDLV